MSSVATASPLSSSVLVLNRFYMAVHVINVRRAVGLLFRELAEVIPGDTTPDTALFAGLAPALLPMVAPALFRVGGRALGHPALIAVAVSAFLALAVLAVPFPVVVAAGNQAVDAAQSAPANCAGVISVAATDVSGALAPYSNFGSVTVAAPGGDPYAQILSTGNAGAQGLGAPTYTERNGTSMAAPVVSGDAICTYGTKTATVSIYGIDARRLIEMAADISFTLLDPARGSHQERQVTAGSARPSSDAYDVDHRGRPLRPGPPCAPPGGGRSFFRRIEGPRRREAGRALPGAGERQQQHDGAVGADHERGENRELARAELEHPEKKRDHVDQHVDRARFAGVIQHPAHHHDRRVRHHQVGAGAVQGVDVALEVGAADHLHVRAQPPAVDRQVDVRGVVVGRDDHRRRRPPHQIRTLRESPRWAVSLERIAHARAEGNIEIADIEIITNYPANNYVCSILIIAQQSLVGNRTIKKTEVWAYKKGFIGIYLQSNFSAAFQVHSLVYKVVAKSNWKVCAHNYISHFVALILRFNFFRDSFLCESSS